MKGEEVQIQSCPGSPPTADLSKTSYTVISRLNNSRTLTTLIFTEYNPFTWDGTHGSTVAEVQTMCTVLQITEFHVHICIAEWSQIFIFNTVHVYLTHQTRLRHNIVKLILHVIVHHRIWTIIMPVIVTTLYLSTKAWVYPSITCSSSSRKYGRRSHDDHNYRGRSHVRHSLSQSSRGRYAE